MSPQFEHKDVQVLEIDGRTFFLVGTAHISKASADLAEEVVRAVNPDSVAVELCESRHESLQDPDRWKNTDVLSVIRSGRAYVLMAQIMLAGFQKKLGKKLEIKPGAEMMRATAVAKELGIKTVLADREVRLTLKRTWAALGFWSTIKLVFMMIIGLFKEHDIDEEEIERLKSADALEELMRDFSESLPGVRTALIDERDQYLAAKIFDAPGDTVVAIIGAGHLKGVTEWLGKDINTEALEEIPPRRLLPRLIAWGVPVLVLALIISGFIFSGKDTGIEMIALWFWINACLGALGAAVALAHPLTVLTAFLASPFTSLNPMIAAGWVAGLTEAALRKPRVGDFETIADDVVTLQGLWGNRLSKILLVVALTNLFGTLGTVLGIVGIGNAAS